MPAIETTPALVRGVYAALGKNVATVRRRLGRVRGRVHGSTEKMLTACTLNVECPWSSLSSPR